MDPVHAVLSNQELLRIVCENAHKDSGPKFVELRSLALVCRAISDMALDVLWNSLRLKNLYCVFPQNIVCTDNRGHKSFTRAPVTLKQWSRFSVHARRIRELSVSYAIGDISLCDALAHYPQLHHPFPRLTCLNLTTTPKSVTKAKVFICPTLTDISFSICYNDDLYDAMVDILQAVTETCSFLRQFKYKQSVVSKYRESSLDDALISLIQHSVHLQSAHVPGSRNMLDVLARLPLLSRLGLYHFICDKKQQQQSESFQEQEPLDQERFRVLECLDLECLGPLEILVKCLRGMGCFPKTELRLHLLGSPLLSTADVEQFVRAVLHPDRSVELRKFEMNSSGRNTGTVPWQPFWRLLSTTHLQKLAFEYVDVDMDDSDLKAISSTLRELRSLMILPSGNITSRITFQGVAHLASLTNLDHASLMVGDDATISQSMLPTKWVPTSPLTSLRIDGPLTRVTAFQVTSFLVKYFPNLTSVGPSSAVQSVKLWSQVQKDLEFARQLFHPLPES